MIVPRNYHVLWPGLAGSAGHAVERYADTGLKNLGVSESFPTTRDNNTGVGSHSLDKRRVSEWLEWAADFGLNPSCGNLLYK